MSKWGSPRAQPDPKPRLKSFGRNPPEPVERRPEPTPATALIEPILAVLEHIPCLKPEYCHGTDDRGKLASKVYPPPTRCHRCAVVRLARSVVGR